MAKDSRLPSRNAVKALIIVLAVGWTCASAVHRIPRRRWWTALRLSTLRCPVAGTVIKAADKSIAGRCDGRSDAEGARKDARDGIGFAGHLLRPAPTPKVCPDIRCEGYAVNVA